jgi:hypothetical protein
MEDASKVTIVLDREVRQLVERQAELECISLSAVCRRAVTVWARTLTADPAARLTAALVLCMALMATAAAMADEVPAPHLLTVADLYRIQHRLGVDHLVVARVGDVLPVDADGCFRVQTYTLLSDGSWLVAQERECGR